VADGDRDPRCGSGIERAPETVGVLPCGALLEGTGDRRAEAHREALRSGEGVEAQHQPVRAHGDLEALLAAYDVFLGRAVREARGLLSLEDVDDPARRERPEPEVFAEHDDECPLLARRPRGDELDGARAVVPEGAEGGSGLVEVARVAEVVLAPVHRVARRWVASGRADLVVGERRVSGAFTERREVRIGGPPRGGHAWLYTAWRLRSRRVDRRTRGTLRPRRSWLRCVIRARRVGCLRFTRGTQDSEPVRSRTAILFHAMLLVGLVPVLSLPFVLAAAHFAWRTAPPPDRRWARRLLALAAVDVLVSAAFVSVYFHPPSELTEVPETPAVIGVRIEGPVDGGGLEVVPVPDSPASRAGLVAGDVIVSVDGVPTDDADALQRAIAAPPIASRVVELRRERETLHLEVVPERLTSAGAPRPGRDGLFTPLGDEAHVCFESGDLLPAPTQLGWYGLALLLFVGLAMAGWRAGVRFGVLAVPLVFALAGAASLATQTATCAALGGPTPGGALVALMVQATVMLVLGAWLARRHEMAPMLPRVPSVIAYAMGLFYAVTWVVRSTILGWATFALGRALVGQTNTPIDVFLQSDLGAGGVALFLAAGGVLGPVAEEALFRGGLLSVLARFLTPWRAIVLTGVVFGVLHVHHGVSMVGPLTLGIVFGWTRAVTGSLVVPVLLHCTFNSMALSLMLLSS